jgi:phosphoglycerol transferase MdoB-like AlkP superfamily enzyme
VPLTFLDQRSFVSQAGFDQIIGEEAFLDAPQYGFDSAPDEYLYDRMISQRKNNDLQPQLIVGQTIATHKPYHTPYGVTRDSAYGYADQQLGDFYNTLKEE